MWAPRRGPGSSPRARAGAGVHVELSEPSERGSVFEPYDVLVPCGTGQNVPVPNIEGAAVAHHETRADLEVDDVRASGVGRGAEHWTTGLGRETAPHVPPDQCDLGREPECFVAVNLVSWPNPVEEDVARECVRARDRNARGASRGMPVSYLRFESQAV